MTRCQKSVNVTDMQPNVTAADIGDNIRAAMGRNRVNMAELSRRTGISRTTLIHQIDVSRITADNLILIAKALGVTTAELLGEATA